jgi:hypothetical protein
MYSTTTDDNNVVTVYEVGDLVTYRAECPVCWESHTARITAIDRDQELHEITWHGVITDCPLKQGLTVHMYTLADEGGQEYIELAEETEPAQAIAQAMPHWGHLVAETDYSATDTLAEVAARAIRAIDQHIAQTSDTPLLGPALDSLRRATDILETLTWWDRAYQAYYDATPGELDTADRTGTVVDRLLDGDLEGAEAAALADEEE